MSYTPGPWEAKCQTGPTWGIWSKSKKGAVAYCGKEDARLIAAAPEMVELLVAVVRNPTKNYRHKIEALLRRIDGEEEKA